MGTRAARRREQRELEHEFAEATGWYDTDEGRAWTDGDLSGYDTDEGRAWTDGDLSE